MNCPWQHISLADKSNTESILLWEPENDRPTQGFWDRWRGCWCDMTEQTMHPQPTMFRKMPLGPRKRP